MLFGWRYGNPYGHYVIVNSHILNLDTASWSMIPGCIGVSSHWQGRAIPPGPKISSFWPQKWPKTGVEPHPPPLAFQKWLGASPPLKNFCLRPAAFSVQGVFSKCCFFFSFYEPCMPGCSTHCDMLPRPSVAYVFSWSPIVRRLPIANCVRTKTSVSDSQYALTRAYDVKRLHLDDLYCRQNETNVLSGGNWAAAALNALLFAMLLPLIPAA